MAKRKKRKNTGKTQNEVTKKIIEASGINTKNPLENKVAKTNYYDKDFLKKYYSEVDDGE